MGNQVIISTGTLNAPYRILNTIIATGSSSSNWTGSNVNKAFDQAKDNLSKECLKQGGNAVIDCIFEHRIAVKGWFFKKQVVEIFAYGTVIQYQ